MIERNSSRLSGKVKELLSFFLIFGLDGVVDGDLLLGELEQHRIVEELADGHVLAQALASPRLDHELARQAVDRLRLKRFDDDALVQRISGHDLPVVEDGEAEGLTLSVRAQVGLEAERVDGWNKGLEHVEWRAGQGCVLGDVATAFGENGVDS